MQLNGAFSYIFLFFSLCVFVYLAMALINMFTKSYQPMYILPYIVVIIILYLFNTAIAFNTIRTTVNRITDSIESNLQEKPKQPLRGKNQF